MGLVEVALRQSKGLILAILLGMIPAAYAGELRDEDTGVAYAEAIRVPEDGE